MSEDRTSDEATGLPPLDELGDDETMVVLAFASGEGIVARPDGESVSCKYLHARGLATDPEGGPTMWVQVHLAIPDEIAMEVAVAIMGGPITE
jgi:hypothetical protein